MKVGLINPGVQYVAEKGHFDMVYVNGILFVESALRQAGTR